MTKFIKWLRSQLRVMGATARKEFLVFTRYPANAVLSLIELIMWLTPLYFMGKAFSLGGQAVGFRLCRNFRLLFLRDGRAFMSRTLQSHSGEWPIPSKKT